MDKNKVLKLLTDVQRGEVSPEHAVERLATLPYEDLSFAKLDHHRALMKGFPEVVLGETKTAEQVVKLVEGLSGNGSTVLVTRASREAADAVAGRFPEARFNPIARTIQLDGHMDGAVSRLMDGVVVVTAATGDIPVAEEASVTAQALGSVANRIDDVGVAGLINRTCHKGSGSGS